MEDGRRRKTEGGGRSSRKKVRGFKRFGYNEHEYEQECKLRAPDDRLLCTSPPSSLLPPDAMRFMSSTAATSLSQASGGMPTELLTSVMSVTQPLSSRWTARHPSMTLLACAPVGAPACAGAVTAIPPLRGARSGSRPSRCASARAGPSRRRP